MQAVISGIALALLSVLGTFAFRYQRAYARLYPYFLWGASISVLLVVTWQAAVEYAWMGLSQYVEVRLFEAARAAKDRLTAPYIGVGLSYVSFMTFLWAIRRLPHFISESEAARSRNDSAGK